MKFSKSAKIGLTGLALGTVLIAAPPQPVFAATTTPIDLLVTETGKLPGVFDKVVPVAIASTVFAIGAVLIKRIAFS